MKRTELERHLTPPQIAKQLAVAEETVRAWIISGELQAANVARRNATRPRYRIDPLDLAAFLQARRPDASPAKRSIRRWRQETLIEFY